MLGMKRSERGCHTESIASLSDDNHNPAFEVYGYKERLAAWLRSEADSVSR